MIQTLEFRFPDRRNRLTEINGPSQRNNINAIYSAQFDAACELRDRI